VENAFMTPHTVYNASLPKRIFRVGEFTARYCKIRRRLGVDAENPVIYHYRGGNIRIGCACLLLSLFCIRSEKPEHVAAVLVLITVAMYFLVDAWLGGAWFVFAGEKLYIRTSAVAGVFHDQFTVDRNDIESVLLDVRRLPLHRYGNNYHHDVAVVTREGKRCMFSNASAVLSVRGGFHAESRHGQKKGPM
jgi:hypothetical protein